MKILDQKSKKELLVKLGEKEEANLNSETISQEVLKEISKGMSMQIDILLAPVKQWT
jgi:hypothetical protein